MLRPSKRLGRLILRVIKEYQGKIGEILRLQSNIKIAINLEDVIKVQLIRYEERGLSNERQQGHNE
jgi:hypothetical protein